jgi:Fic-DOC domain mobile mystery protein B
MASFDYPPGATPINDISGLRIKGVSKLSELNALEAENNRKATVKYLSAKPARNVAKFDLSWVCRLHKEMFGDVWDWAGDFRREDLNIGCPWQQIEQRVENLLRDLEFWEKNNHDILDQAVLLHHRAVWIHPFKNGNGRWARMLANIWLRMHDHEIIAWPEEAIGKQSPIRDEYLAAIQKADDGDFEKLKEVHGQFIQPVFPWAAIRRRRHRRPPGLPPEVLYPPRKSRRNFPWPKT